MAICLRRLVPSEDGRDVLLEETVSAEDDEEDVDDVGDEWKDDTLDIVVHPHHFPSPSDTERKDAAAAVD